jgi:SpoVK/Ycf46/Vps4 family AAA+-type ATPase
LDQCFATSLPPNFSAMALTNGTSSLVRMEKKRKRVSEASRPPSPSQLPSVSSTIIFGGYSEFQEKLQFLVEWPLKEPARFHQLGVSPPRGVIFYGVSGVGKTLLAENLAKNLQVKLISMNGSEFAAALLGESERKMTNAFKTAQSSEPCILLINNVEIIASEQEKASGQMDRRMVSHLASCFDLLRFVG